jgi:hypothetical protein
MSYKEDPSYKDRIDNIRGTELYSYALQHTVIIITPKALSHKVESRPASQCISGELES